MAPQIQPDPLSALLKMRNVGGRVPRAEDYRYAGAVPTQGELSSPFEQEQSRRATMADTRDRAKVGRIEDVNAQVAEFDRPDVTEMRGEQHQMALEKLLGPKRLEGEYDLERQRIASRGQVEAAGTRAETQAGTQENIRQRMARTQAATRERMLEIQRRADLLKQAQAAEKTSRSPWGWLKGAPSGEERAADLREQATGGDTDTDSMDPLSFAQELADQDASMTPSQLEAAIRETVDLSVLTPEDIQSVIEAYSAITGR